MWPWEDKKTARKSKLTGCFGDPAGIRTPDTLLKRQVLCQLSYWVRRIKNYGWGGRTRTSACGSQSPLPYHLATPPCSGEKRKDLGPEPKLRPFRLYVGWVKGLEPSTPGTTIRCSNQLSYTHHIKVELLKEKNGTPEGTRTPGPLLRRQLLYPPELQAHMERVMGIEPTRPAWKAGILPLNYTRMLVCSLHVSYAIIAYFPRVCQRLF